MGESRSYRGRDVTERIRDADRWGLVYMEVVVAVVLLARQSQTVEAFRSAY